MAVPWSLIATTAELNRTTQHFNVLQDPLLIGFAPDNFPSFPEGTEPLFDTYVEGVCIGRRGELRTQLAAHSQARNAVSGYPERDSAS
jgi:hypothetical protein